MKRGWKIAGGVVGLAVVVLAGLFLLAIRVPRPQVASASGQVLPDFTVKDQGNRDFTLSSLGGSPVLLIFYRGYW